MTECPDIRRSMLEADPTALAGLGDGVVAQHVRTCASCAAAARVILEETAALDRHLEGGPLNPDIDAILSAGLQDGPGPEATPETAQVIRFPGWRRWAGLAAAAAIAGLLLFRPDAPQPTAVERVAQTPPLMEAAPEQNVAVLETANPDITVLWFF